jgi:hypothetical protein
MVMPDDRQRPIGADGIDWRGIGEFAGRRDYCSEMRLASRCGQQVCVPITGNRSKIILHGVINVLS